MLTMELVSVGEKMKRGGMVRPKGEEMRRFGDGTVERGVYDRKRELRQCLRKSRLLPKPTLTFLFS